MHRRVAAAVLGVVVASAVLVPSLGGVANAAPKDKVVVCHATHSETNPYVLISVPEDAAFGHVNGSPHGPQGNPDLRPAEVDDAAECGAGQG